MALGIYFIFGTKYSWNKGIDTCFNVDCMLLGRNFDFLGGYLVVTARNLLITADYCLLPGGYWWLLLVTGGYCWLPLVLTFSMNAQKHVPFILTRSSRFKGAIINLDELVSSE